MDAFIHTVKSRSFAINYVKKVGMSIAQQRLYFVLIPIVTACSCCFVNVENFKVKTKGIEING